MSMTTFCAGSGRNMLLCAVILFMLFSCGFASAEHEPNVQLEGFDADNVPIRIELRSSMLRRELSRKKVFFAEMRVVTSREGSEEVASNEGDGSVDEDWKRVVIKSYDLKLGEEIDSLFFTRALEFSKELAALHITTRSTAQPNGESQCGSRETECTTDSDSDSNSNAIAPRLFFFNENTIVIERVDGTSLADILADNNRECNLRATNTIFFCFVFDFFPKQANARFVRSKNLFDLFRDCMESVKRLALRLLQVCIRSSKLRIFETSNN
jgi:hypothetical protein